MKKVIIVRDLTPVRRHERRNRLASRRGRDQFNQPNTSKVTNQNQDNHNQSAAIEVNGCLSPISHVSPVSNVMSSTHLSQVNQFTDSQPVRDLSAVYDDTTLREDTHRWAKSR